MHELLYYSIFAIVLYFVLIQVFENFNIEQENFDPSLVPVSSIVTLAKVAQKLVNGNGTLTNPGNLQIGSSASAPGNLTVTGNFLLGNKAMLYANGDKFANDNWVRLMKADGATAYSGMNGGGLAVSNLYSEQDTTANRNLQVNGNINANGTSSFGGQGEFGFQWGNENNNGWSCLRTNRGNKENRLCFNRDHGLAHFHPGGHLDIQGKITVPRLETGTISATGNINARTDGFNTRIGGIWTAPGIYAEGTANLEIGAGSNNIYVGAANGGANQNLIVTNDLITRNGQPSRINIKDVFNGHPGITTEATDRPLWILPGNKEVYIGHPNAALKSDLYVTGNLILPSDRKLIFSDANNSIGFNSGDGVKIRSWNGGTLDTVHGNNTVMSWDNGGVTVRSGKLFCIGGTCINETHLKALTGAHPIGIENKRVRDAGHRHYLADRPYNPNPDFYGTHGDYPRYADASWYILTS